MTEITDQHRWKIRGELDLADGTLLDRALLTAREALWDRGCRVPGCSHDRIIEIHHIIHWIDGGVTDSWNLVALCPMHHRWHHNGRLGISGNADEPNGLIFTDSAGRPLPGCGRPEPPDELPKPPNGYNPPLMGRVDWKYVGLGWIPPDTEP